MPAIACDRFAITALLLAASLTDLSTKAADPNVTPAPVQEMEKAKVTLAHLRRQRAAVITQPELPEQQRRAIMDARTRARLQVAVARERLREIRFEHASPSKEK